MSKSKSKSSRPFSSDVEPRPVTDACETEPSPRAADSPGESGVRNAAERDSGTQTTALVASEKQPDVSQAEILPAVPGWMSRHPSTVPVLTPRGRSKRFVRRLARRLAGGDDSSTAMTAMARAAADLKRNSGQAAVSIAVTSTGPGNRLELTAIGLATRWARWEHNTLLLDAAGLTPISAISRTSLDELAEALSRGNPLPAPPLLTSALERLEVIATTSAASLARLSETGHLVYLMEALRQRYERIVWALPPVGSAAWTICLTDGIVDQVVLSACKGKADRSRIGEAAAQLATHGRPPLQVFWHG